MSRPAEKTEVFNPDDARRIEALFGTASNAAENLGVPVRYVREAFRLDPLRPEEARDLSLAWDRWRLYFGLRNDVIDFRWENMENPGRARGFNVAPRLSDHPE